MIPNYSLNFSDNSGAHSFQLKKIDQNVAHLPINVISIDKINYKIKGSDEEIARLKTHISTGGLVSFGGFSGSLQENQGIVKKESVIFKNTIATILAPTKTEAEEINAIQLHIEKLSKNKDFSGTVIIAKNNSDTLLETYTGFRNIELKKLNDDNTQFNLASMTKMFTIVGILQLMEQKELSLDDPIGKYLSKELSLVEVDPNGKHLSNEITNENMKKVTIHQLLTHTGGAGKIEGNYWEIETPKGFIENTKNKEPSFIPGTQCSYSNLGFVLLGAIIENVSKMDYYTYIQEKIFNVAEMKNSNYQLKTMQSSSTAIGYMGENSKELESNHRFLPLRATPAGCSYSTGQDLLAFSNALQNNKLLKVPSSLELIQTNLQVTTDLHPTNHAIGFMTGDGWYGHTGDYEGANGELRIYPKLG
nr:beta-lactamase family protein [Parachlamydiaceae bacterium]